MALGFKMGASGEKPRTETYNVTENGTFDMGAKNSYRYVNANVEAPTPTVVRLSHTYDPYTRGDYTFSITKVEECVPLIQLTATNIDDFYIRDITENSLTVTKKGTTDSATVYVNVIWIPNVKKVTNIYNQTINSAGTSIDYGFTASNINKVLINVKNFNTRLVRQPANIGMSSCTLYGVGGNSLNNLIQIFEFE